MFTFLMVYGIISTKKDFFTINHTGESLWQNVYFLIVLDSFGIGAEPDAALFGDAGTNTLGAIAGHPSFKGDNLAKLGMFNLDGVTCGTPVAQPLGSFARLREASAGKDTTIGHWEIAGLLSAEPLPTFPDGFPQELLDEFTARTGYKVLCNKPLFRHGCYPRLRRGAYENRRAHRLHLRGQRFPDCRQ